MRDAAINLRALPEQRDLIDYAARLLGKSRSDFMLEAACDRAKAVVLDQDFSVWTPTSSSSSPRCSTHLPAPIPGLNVSCPSKRFGVPTRHELATGRTDFPRRYSHPGRFCLRGTQSR
jgi:hypothetical protein